MTKVRTLYLLLPKIGKFANTEKYSASRYAPRESESVAWLAAKQEMKERLPHQNTLQEMNQKTITPSSKLYNNDDRLPAMALCPETRMIPLYLSSSCLIQSIPPPHSLPHGYSAHSSCHQPTGKPAELFKLWSTQESLHDSRWSFYLSLFSSHQIHIFRPFSSLSSKTFHSTITSTCQTKSRLPPSTTTLIHQR
jgi:hypothetical protein